jgi:hypothetical protein
LCRRGGDWREAKGLERHFGECVVVLLVDSKLWWMGGEEKRKGCLKSRGDLKYKGGCAVAELAKERAAAAMTPKSWHLLQAYPC